MACTPSPLSMLHYVQYGRSSSFRRNVSRLKWTGCYMPPIELGCFVAASPLRPTVNDCKKYQLMWYVRRYTLSTAHWVFVWNLCNCIEVRKRLLARGSTPLHLLTLRREPRSLCTSTSRQADSFSRNSMLPGGLQLHSVINDYSHWIYRIKLHTSGSRLLDSRHLSITIPMIGTLKRQTAPG
jgi:hypothetical protein